MRIVALVGADGAGKSTQAARLTARLEAEGYRTKRVRPLFLLFDPWRLRPTGQVTLSPRRARTRSWEDGGKPRGTVRSAVTATAGFLYAIVSYAAMRIFLRGVDYIVCDRYFYQYFYDLAGQSADRLARSFPKPDVALWLDAPPELLRARIERLPNGHEPTAYLEAVVGYYRTVATELGWVRIDAAPEAQDVEANVWRGMQRGWETSAA